MMQLIPFHEAVDLSLWPSPFDASISKRKLEQWYFYVRSAIRLLRESVITTSSYRQLGREMPGILQIRNLMRTLPKRLTIENGDLRQTLNPKP